MTDPTRGTRLRRSGRRPGWFLMTVLLVLAIGASSALVFTNRVELLKLAVILALWAAVVAAFVSVIYRRQSDADQAKVRDLKLVYDLQLDREISARREYELAVESQLRRELASELRAQSADEVAALRAELAALRANLEYLFDADLSDRPALETERTAGRVSSSRIDTEDDFVVTPEPDAPETDESPIIDVPVEPHLPEHEWVPAGEAGGAHRRSAEQAAGRRHRADDAPAPQPQWGPPPPPRGPVPGPTPPAPPPQPQPQFPWLPPQPHPQTASAGTQWQPAPAQGQFIPAGKPGSHWQAAAPAETPPADTPPAAAAPADTPPADTAPADTAPADGAPDDEYVGRRRAPDSEPPRGKHYAPGEEAPPAPEEEPVEEDADGGAHTGGQSVAELLARLQAASPSGGGRRRRRED